MSMMWNTLLALVLLMTGAMPAFAASEADYKTALSAAEAAEKQADQLRHKWTTTEAQLAAAKKAAAGGDFDTATQAATEAEALAKASIFQATSEKKRWKDLEIR
jgi:multidrug resistance efflux pump